MFEAEQAKALSAALEDMTAQLEKIAAEELELHRQVNPGGGPTPISPDAVAILSARMQIVTLTNAVMTIGTTLREILKDRIAERDMGLD
ncbi:MAG: hypothetical protein BGN98_10370 [Microbacterium sp. 69-7]|uniref:hypothetical protein n=1 Tax=Microbacterium sp. 69-7 TaxID=1895784 RepID=UPI0009644AEA|nr:hypothetical protein [Microbacterium sp. 69-7]OJU43611.1 MAG: hypothetical protein BGN98_10370 [Microbacterium sp. 69-7]